MTKLKAADRLPRRRTYGEALSEQELKVLREIALGQTNEHIGRSLYLATNTVKFYVSNMLAKLGANDRAHAVTIGFTTGLLTPSMFATVTR